MLNTESTKISVWDIGGERQVKGMRDQFFALILCTRRSPFTMTTLVFSTAAFSTCTGSWLNLSALIPRYAKCMAYPSGCEAAQGLFLYSIQNLLVMSGRVIKPESVVCKRNQHLHSTHNAVYSPVLCSWCWRILLFQLDLLGVQLQQHIKLKVSIFSYQSIKLK